jgi:transcriptional regulator
MPVGHMARANDHWKLFARGAPSLALFWGPHAYVSPTWYTPGPKVPTWNYVTVHAYGRPEIVEATPAVLMVLTRLAAQYEGSAPTRGPGPPACPANARQSGPGTSSPSPHAQSRGIRDQAEAQPEPRARPDRAEIA